MKLITESLAYLNEFLEMIYPSNIKCVCCEGELENKIAFNICEYCQSKIEFKPVWSSLYIEREYSQNYTEVLTVTEYNKVIRRLIYKFKYNSQTYIAREMASIMANFLEGENLSFDVIIPVPLFVAKKRKRGFNQAELLAKYLGEHIKVRHDINVLGRIKETETMHMLTKEQRRENVKGVFSVEDPTQIPLKNILLVDDIYTTGATIKECSEVLLNAGASKVTAVAFARS
ncbi:MAG: ComF family protein [Clostridiales bacterium]|nr:ComF family protein [Clostridiales bacterium]